MLKKLYKHEFIALYRIVLPLYAVLIGLAASVRILNLFDDTNKIVNSFRTINTTLTTIMTFALFIASFIVIIIRFCKNFLSKEGYLTFSLPIKASAHIICKLLCGIVVSITNVISVICALWVIFGNSKTYNDILCVIKGSYNALTSTLGAGKTVAYIVELFFAVIFSLCANFLLFYASISIGQQFKKKGLASVISYVCLYTVIEIILMTVTLPLTTVFGKNLDSLETFSSAMLIFFAVIIAIELLQCFVYYLITNYFLSRKLNLE